jgi:hypothetical protein
MNYRHGTVLALIGWYLLMSPWAKTGWDASARISSWDLISSHDTAKECEQAKNELTHPPYSKDPEARKYDLRMQSVNMAARCIASDDPRLKAN